MNFNKIYSFIIISLLCLISLPLLAQHIEKVNIPVKSPQGQTYRYPWAGGLNSCQFGMLDINGNGIKDLVVFDRVGNRIMPFLFTGTPGNAEYVYAPEYAHLFPDLYHWAIFADYDGDGKEDIFTYNTFPPGIIVYRNVSENELEFILQVYPFLTSNYGSGYVNILVTYADYPAIFDLDGDGDLDILTFWGLGSFVEKHRNMSMEIYGHADSLVFERTDICWGYFAESEESNLLSLDTCLGWYRAKSIGHRAKGIEQVEGGRHTGSTFQLLDLNGDGLVDLLLGDVDYPNLVALYNGGTVDSAHMVSYEWTFPAGNIPIHLFSMPVSFYGDIDRDGVKDLLVSPFDPSPFISENLRSIWYYRNHGTDDHPQFVLQTRSFLQDEMIDAGAGAYPVLHDFDGDGLHDLFIGNYGYYDTSYYDQYLTLYTEQTGMIGLLRNTGTAQTPSFNFIERDFANASSLDLKGIMPAFGDVNGDGKTDMIIGCEDGTLLLYINQGALGEPMDLVLSQQNFQGIDVGFYSAPQLFDFDRDGLPDLIIGERGGNVNYYRNTGTLQNPVFTLVTDSLGKVNVTDYLISLYGFSTPYFFRDTSDRTHLLVGSEQGEIFYYTGIDEAGHSGAFKRSDTLAALIGLQELKTKFGYRIAAALADLTGDGVPELIVGNFSGGLEYFGISAPPFVSGTSEPANEKNLVRIFPQPVSEMLHINVDDNFTINRVDIMDLSGRLVHTHQSIDKISCDIDVSKLVNGLYIIRIFLHEKPSGRQVIICEKMLKIL